MPTRVLGVDPGLTRCGYGLVEQGNGRAVQLVEVGVVATGPEKPLAERIGIIAAELERLIVEHKPSSIALERVFAQSNLPSVMGVAQISGVVLLLAHRYSVPLAMHTPTEVKSAVTGNGRANKAQVGFMVAKILGLQEAPKPADAADALAIAITHIWRIGVAAGTDTGSASTRATKAQEQWRAALAAAKKK